MNPFSEALFKALDLMLKLDPELLRIVLLSFQVSGLALILSTAAGLPVAAVLGLRQFPMKGFLIALFNTFTGLPPVIAGLFIYLLLSRSGPLGFLGLLYTPSAMTIAQFILAFPIVVSLCRSAIADVDPVVRQAAETLGADERQTALTIIHEARYGIMSGIIAAFGRVMAEVGAILIVGGNIAGHTRVMTTAIALETDKGNFELALALGILLLGLSLIINLTLYLVQKKGARRGQKT